MNTHIDYIENSHDDDSLVFSEAEIEQFGLQLNDPQSNIQLKKKILGILAHRGDVQSYNILKTYVENPDVGLEEWAKFAYGECTMFLHADICSDDDYANEEEWVFTGVGKKNNMLRIYFMVLPDEGKLLETWQHDIIRNEMTYIANDLNCEAIEWFDCQPHYVGFSLLQPTTISILQFIDPAIAACNVFGNFLIPDYYAGTGIPVGKEIDQIIDIVYHGEEQTFETEEQPY